MIDGDEEMPRVERRPKFGRLARLVRTQRMAIVMLRRSVAACLLAAWFLVPRAATAASWAETVKAYAVLGCPIAEEAHGKTEEILVACDRDKVIAEFPKLQQLGLMNPDITQTQLNVTPNVFAEVFLQEVTAELVHPYYANKPGDHTLWGGALVVPDRYGHERSHLAFTFRFTRALNDRIDWDHFHDADMAKVAIQFQFTPWLLQQ